MRVRTKAGEGIFAHVRATDDHRAGAAQKANRVGVSTRSRRMAQAHATGSRHFTRDIEQVLYGNRDTFKKGPRRTSCKTPVAVIGFRPRTRGSHRHERSPRIGNAPKRLLDQRTGTKPLPQADCNFRNGSFPAKRHCPGPCGPR
jgi:hypothetical protein